jgi:hypothetical protein
MPMVLLQNLTWAQTIIFMAAELGRTQMMDGMDICAAATMLVQLWKIAGAL